MGFSTPAFTTALSNDSDTSMAASTANVTRRQSAAGHPDNPHMPAKTSATAVNTKEKVKCFADASPRA